MGSISEKPSFQEAPIDERQFYPARQQDQPYVPRSNGQPPLELSTPILVIGGGPVGLYLSIMLARHYRQQCMVVEQYTSTTVYPKMEFTNGRSMEFLRQIGLADDLRAIGVPEEYDLDEIFPTSLGPGGRNIATWKRYSPAEIRRRMKEQNDGSWAREPYLRLPQVMIENYLRGVVAKQEGIESHYGWKFVELHEKEDAVYSLFFNLETSQEMKVKSQYVVGSDGGGSRVRKCADLESERKALDLNVIFVHFKTTDKHMFDTQGHFWHANMLNGGIIVNQNEKDTYTVHTIVPPGVELSHLKSSELVSRSMGGLLGPVDVNIELICRGEWKAQVAIADNFRSKGGRIFLAGDAAHQLSPVGGHGLNSGMGDVWDLSWKLAAVLKGWGGEGLLESYDIERRAVAFNNLAMVEKGIYEVFMPMLAMAAEFGAEQLHADTSEGESARKQLEDHIAKHHWLHGQDGTSMGFRYNTSPIIAHDGEQEPQYKVSTFIPSSWPGARAPQVLLKDGETSTYDLLQPGFNFFDFTPEGRIGRTFLTACDGTSVPMSLVHLPREDHVRDVWGRDVVLVRPDGHIGWRLPVDGAFEVKQVVDIVELVIGGKA